jgi:hypothetical protein
MFVKMDWPGLVQKLLRIYTVSYNENSVYWVIMHNFVITLSIGTYGINFHYIHYTQNISPLLLETKNFHMENIHKNYFLHVKIVMFCLCISVCANCQFAITIRIFYCTKWEKSKYIKSFRQVMCENLFVIIIFVLDFFS